MAREHETLVERQAAEHQRALLSEFASRLPPGRDDLCVVAGEVMERFSDGMQEQLVALVRRYPGSIPRSWLHARFDRAVEQFATTLRLQTPEHLRHAVAQVLQLKLLEAERRFVVELDRLSSVLSSA